MLHDIDEDGVIGPTDINDLQGLLATDYPYMLTFDVLTLSEQIKKKMDSAPKKSPNQVVQSLLAEVEVR